MVPSSTAETPTETLRREVLSVAGRVALGPHRPVADDEF